MLVRTGWWELVITGVEDADIDDCQLEHIGKKIAEGYTEGQICIEEEENGDCNEAE